MLQRLKDVFKSFADRDVRYVVIGGIAAVMHGVPRATFDVDLLIEPTSENASRLLSALAKAEIGTAIMITPEELLANEITVFSDRVRIDVQTSTPGLTFENAWRNRLAMDFEGQAFFVASKDDLIASKRAAGRAIDLEDVRLLESSVTSRSMRPRFAALAIMIVVGVLCASTARADDTDKFLYQPDRVPVGRVFHYMKTNLDGSNPERIALFVAARDRIEAFKYHLGGIRAGRVIAWMDWTSCTVRRLESWQVPLDGEPVLFGIAAAGSEGRSVDVRMPPLGPVERVEIAWRPWHIYNFDLASLNVAMAHLTNPRDTVTIGLVDPTFAEAGPQFHYRGEATLAYVRDETRGGEKCRLYAIDGPGLDGKGGTIWSRMRDGFFQDVEIALADNPDWTSFKLKLDRTGRMSEKQWEKFMRAAPR